MIDRPFVDFLPDEPRAPSRDLGPTVAAGVAARHGLTVEAMLAKGKGSHVPKLSRARTELYVELLRYRMSMQEIADFVKRDRTTVLAAVQAHQAREVRP